MVGGINAVALIRPHAPELFFLMLLHSTNLMTLPVRPPILPSADCTDEAAFERDEPAELCTLVRPSEAFETPLWADCLAWEAASLAFSVVDEALRN